ncbi:MAG: hypothetical protein RMK29_18645 [Myxococcales bacterium]|nr:hypothetical protein [Myxococcota bacterium]MDW8283728.1 hypothetical protein [Myxococcales bacterium]
MRMNPKDEKLIRLHDDELEPAEAEELATQLTAVDRDKLHALDELRQLLRGTLRVESEGVDLWAGIQERLPRPATRRLWAPVVAAMLCAAALLIVLLRPIPAPTSHCVIESLEVAGAMATVLDIPDDRGDSTTVIWMDHEESDEWESL